MFYIMSIRSSYANQIISGKKTVEIRRALVHMKKGDKVAIYATLPVAKIIGFYIVNQVIYDKPEMIWKQYQKEMCISHDIFVEYTAKKDKLSAIMILSVKKVDGKALSEIAISIPQSYKRITESCFVDLCNLSIPIESV